MTIRAQHLDALDRANTIRFAKAEIKRELRALPPAEAMMFASDVVAGYATIAGFPPEALGAFRLGELLSAIPRCGPQKQRAIAHRARLVSIDRRIRDLTERERMAVAAVLCSPPYGTVFRREAA